MTQAFVQSDFCFLKQLYDDSERLAINVGRPAAFALGQREHI
ncbi:hypothetical protein SJ05684_b53370 (plasmid) [Sinorhizobium sojae CCBAU 05684]|uniref:Uncharacterized protein n=1 Tax=Sinorhizobium sojae CCBAU 05684 TaxID=716928 RepID=A0A249PLY6_9HYPH|nr:hypothetical protein [Sinorhizobium sojae]ASY66319.1 hypothetical protein SJ05684_b53370 [Sinorhizobium sojae CCBAU 05684]